MINIHELTYWNARTYGQALTIKKNWARAIVISLGIIIPVIFPVPLAAIFAKKLIKKDWVIRYD